MTRIEPIPPEVARKLAVRIGHGQEAVAVGGRAGVIEWTNSAWERITGWALERSVSKPIARLLSEIGIERDVLDFVSANFLAGRRSSVELPIDTPDGRSLWIHLEVEPCRDETGEISDFVAVATDITDRRLAEQALERHMERQLVDSVPDASADRDAPVAELRLLASEAIHAARDLQALAERLAGEPSLQPEEVLALAHELRECVAPLARRAEGVRPVSKLVHVPELVARCCREVAPRMAARSTIDLALCSKSPRALVSSEVLADVLVELMSASARELADSWGTLSVTAGATEPGRALASEVYHTSFFGTLGDVSPRVFIELHDTAPNLSPSQLSRIAGELLPAPSEGRDFALLRARLRLEEMGAELHVNAVPGSGTRTLILLPTAP